MGINLVLIEWDKLPDYMKNDSVREYYNILKEKKNDMIVYIGVGLISLLIIILIILILIKKKKNKKNTSNENIEVLNI